VQKKKKKKFINSEEDKSSDDDEINENCPIKSCIREKPLKAQEKRIKSEVPMRSSWPATKRIPIGVVVCFHKQVNCTIPCAL
jgi:hypothetical protein